MEHGVNSLKGEATDFGVELREIVTYLGGGDRRIREIARAVFTSEK